MWIGSNIRCRFTRVWLDSYIRRELPAVPRAHVARHLQGCPQCQAYYEARAKEIRALTDDLGALGRPRRPRLEAIWRGVQHDLAQPAPASGVPPVRTALIVTVFVAMLLAGNARHDAPALRLANDPPPVARLALTPTPSSLLEMQLDAPSTMTARLVLQNTPNTSQSE